MFSWCWEEDIVNTNHSMEGRITLLGMMAVEGSAGELHDADAVLSVLASLVAVNGERGEEAPARAARPKYSQGQLASN
jgi:hypothetical protein